MGSASESASRSLISPRLLLALACLLFALQELPYFQTRWIEDENSYSDAAWTFAQEGHIRMSMWPPLDVGSVVDVRPPAMTFALGSAFKTVGLGIWQARLLPFLSALCAIFVTYLLGAFLVDRWVGAIAALLLATDNMLFVAGRTARPDAIIACLNTLVVLLFLAAIRRNSWRLALAAGLTAGISMNFHINGAIAPIAMGLLALYEYGLQVWRKPVAWVFALTVAACVLPYVLWINADALHQQAFHAMQSLGTTVPSGKIHGELRRYADFLGYGNQKLPLPIHIPVRAPIAILIVAGLGFLYARNRRVFWYLALPLLTSMAWWLYLANKNVRYTAVAAPLFALIVAAGACALAAVPKMRWIAVAACLAYGGIQVAGNAYLVYRSRTADYHTLAARLQLAIPEGTTAYGANTFWLALQGRRYYSYDRSPFDYAIANLNPQYLILYDRVMVSGSGLGDDDFGEVRTKAAEFVRTHATRTGTIEDPFYGDLEIYRVRGAEAH